MSWTHCPTDQLEVREVNFQELKQFQEQHYPRIFSNRSDSLVPRKPSVQRKDISAYELRLIIYKEGVPVGWHAGRSSDQETYYMMNSAVLEEYRGQGLYAQLLKSTLKKVGEEGFQVTTSLHHGNNPAVLIPKLREGFVISGTQFNERFRFLIELKYFFDPERRREFGRLAGLDYF